MYRLLNYSTKIRTPLLNSCNRAFLTHFSIFPLSSKTIITSSFNRFVSFSSTPTLHHEINTNLPEFCSGCGVQIQTEEPTKLGYCPQNILETRIEASKKILCKRCYQMIYNGRSQPQKLPDNIIPNMISSFPYKRNSLVVVLLDILDIPGSIYSDIESLTEDYPVLVLVNKSDLLPKGQPLNYMKRWVNTQLNKKIKNIKEVLFISTINDYGLDKVLNFLDTNSYKHIYITGLTNVGKSSFINRILHLSNTHTKPDILKSLDRNMNIYTPNSQISTLSSEEDIDKEIDPSSEPVTSLTVSPFPSTTLGLLSIPISNKHYTFYDTPGFLPNSYKLMVLNLLLNDSQKNVKNIFPSGSITPTVFTLKPNQSLLLGSMIRIDYINDSIKDNLIGYLYSALPGHIHNKDRVESILINHAGKDYVPFYSKEQYDLMGGIINQSKFPLRNILGPLLSYQTLNNAKHGCHAICDVALGPFGWVSLFTQATDGTARKLQQINTGLLDLYAIKGVELIIRQSLTPNIPKQFRKMK